MDLLRSICRLYDIGDDPVALDAAGGTAGDSVAFDCGGKRYLLRLRSPEHAAPGQVRFEHELLGVLAGEGFPVAAPLPSRSGATFVVAGGRTCAVFGWIEGERFEPGNADQLAELGRTLARYHRITARIRRHKPGQGREDDPDRLAAELAEYTGGATFPAAEGVLAALAELRSALHAGVCGRAPQAVIHGDLHPGNVKFRGGRVVGLFDFDWANRAERVRDVGDGILFFAAERPAGLDAGDIWSLTAGGSPDARQAGRFLAAYESLNPLAPAETAALPQVMAARWLQVRIRGMRKVPPERRIEFLDRGDLLDVLGRILSFRLGR